jgi:phage terminase large subunit-like protein
MDKPVEHPVDDNNVDLAWKLLPGWTHYIPQNHKPWAKQLAFCMLPHFEALYGGAAGGGKSDALLMAALMFVDVPYYSAIIFRRTLTDLQQNEGLLTRAHEWLDPWPDVRYIPSLHTFVFPSGARLTFGYIGSFSSWEHYQGSAYQFIGWDELTQHSDIDYKEMISRARRVQCPLHGGRVIDGERAPLADDPRCDGCRMYGPLSRVPIRIRSTSNPGGRGHMWVKKRFAIHKDKKSGLWVSGNPERPFIPASFLDNPALDQKNYEKRLDELDEARKAQLKEGDWDKLAMGRYKHDQFRNFIYRGGYYSLIDPATGEPSGGTFHEDQLLKYSVCDVATSVRTGVAGETFYKNTRGPSWTVIGTFGITPNVGTKAPALLVLDVVRFQEESPYLFPAMREIVAKWKPTYMGIDANGPGRPIYQLAMEQGIPAKELMPRGSKRVHFDKIANSVEAQNLAKSGRVFVPFDAAWVDDFIGELTVWTGHPWDVDDQVDVLSNGAHEFTLLSGNWSRDLTLASHSSETPIVQKFTAETLFFNDAVGPEAGQYYDPPNLNSTHDYSNYFR